MRDRELYILQEDKQAAISRIAELEKEIQDLGPEFYDVFNQTSETWHDNAPFDALRDRQSVMFAELQNLKAVLKSAAVSVPKQNKKKIGIGAHVIIENIDLGKTHLYFVAGNWTYRTGQKVEDSIVISVDAPLAQAFVGKREGDTLNFRHTLKVHKIEYR